MALNNFFKINFPYGIMKNDNNEWTCFNREYKPLGYKDSLTGVDPNDFIYCKYKGLTERILRKLGDTPGSIQTVDDKIVKVFFYSDATNPSNISKNELYSSYFEKIRLLSELKVQ
tara:strand:+ start:315 stop:659 length:345 start_codon:yes stop_codon:yes gene_type:complete